MGLYEDMLARATPGAFPDVPADPVDEQKAVQDAAEAAALRMRKAYKPGAPALPQGSLLPFGALGAGMLSPSIAPEQTAMDQTPAPSFDGGAPVPRDRPKEADGTTVDDPGALPPNSTPTTTLPQPDTVGPPVPISPPTAPQPTAPTATVDQPTSFGSLASGLMSGLKNNSNTLLALGAGFAGAPNIGQGISRAASAAIPASQADLKNRMTLDSQRQTLQALVAKGIPVQDALAAISNPEVMKATVAKYFETKPFIPHKIGVDMAGNDIMGSFNPNNNKFYDAAGRELGAGQSGGAALPDAGAGMLAKGVTALNQDLPADEFKAQFSPAVQAEMDAYIRGDTMPTGNPRLKGSAAKIKEWATLYGSKAGIPVSDATFSERRKYNTELGSTSPATAGGQAKAFNQGIEHADKLATHLEDLHNVDPVGIPAVASGINSLRQTFSTKQSGIATRAQALGQTLAGEVGKLFSGSAGGGVHERELTRQRFNTVKSPTELAGALEGTLETMDGGLKALEQRRDQVLGPNSGRDFVTQETRAKIARIQDVIARLKGETAAPTAAAPAGKTSTGVQWSIVQ